MSDLKAPCRARSTASWPWLIIACATLLVACNGATRRGPDAVRGFAVIHLDTLDDLEPAVESADDGDVIELAAGTFILEDTEINPPRNTQLTIRGQGRGITTIQLKGRATAFMIRTDSVGDFSLSDLSIVGEGNDCDTTGVQSAFEMLSGVKEHHNFVFRNLEIRDVTTGMIIGGNTIHHAGGPTTNVLIENSTFSNIRACDGNHPGWGYGVALNDVYGAVVRSNSFVDIDRHSIYQGYTSGMGDVLIENNLVLRHGPDAPPAYPFAAVVVARSQGVTVANNVIAGTRGWGKVAALSIEWDDERTPPQTTESINVVDNWFVANGWSDVWINESPAAPFVFSGNRFARFDDHADPWCQWAYHTPAVDNLVPCDMVPRLLHQPRSGSRGALGGGDETLEDSGAGDVQGGAGWGRHLYVLRGNCLYDVTASGEHEIAAGECYSW